MVEEEPNPDSIKDLIKTINELLELSFGEGFMGNSDLERNVSPAVRSGERPSGPARA